MSSTKPTNLFTAMTIVTAEIPQILKQSMVLNEVYDKLYSLFITNGILPICRVEETIYSGDTLRMGAEWCFRFGSNDAFTARAVVVAQGPKLTNDLLLTAQRCSLLQAFFIDLKSVDNVNTYLAANGQKPVVTADQLKTATPEQFAEASKKRKNWLDAIPRLNPKKIDDWNAHAQLLKDLPGLDEDSQKELFKEMKGIASEKKIGFDSKNKCFYFFPQSA